MNTHIVGRCCSREICQTCEAEQWAGLTYVTIPRLCYFFGGFFTFPYVDFLWTVLARVYSYFTYITRDLSTLISLRIFFTHINFVKLSGNCSQDPKF